MANAIKCLGTITNENIIEENEVEVNGVLHRLAYINSTTVDNNILFPDADNGTKTYDSATGAVVTHASAAEAFEGLVTNGDFRNGDDGSWSKGGVTTIDTTGLTLDTDLGAYADSINNTGVGTDWTVDNVIEFHHEAISGNSRIQVYLVDTVSVRVKAYSTDTGTIKVNVPANTNTSGARVLFYKAAAHIGVSKITSVSVRPATESVITSRQDFVFLESWHEKISDKDIVYPLGNVQYGVSSWEGIALSNTLVAQGYSAFGEWDATTKGYAVVWSTLSDANKTKFLQDPENNIYVDDGELIQVRYRVRVIEGLGDDWEQINPSSNIHFRFDSFNYIAQRGQFSSNPDYSVFSSAFVFLGKGSSSSLVSENGLYSPHNAGTNTAKAYNGLCFATPIALVQRRNQGAYHPVHNPEGTCEVLNVGETATPIWHKLGAKVITSTEQCFDFYPTNLTGYAAGINGNIASAVSGRPDGKFYDAVYASDIKDLRKSSKLLPRAEIRENAVRMAKAGEVRGVESVPFSYSIDSGSVPTGLTYTGLYVDDVSKFAVGDKISAIDSTDDSILIQRAVITQVGSDYYGDFIKWANDPTITTITARSYWLIREVAQTHKQANPTWTDIIGDPANIAATFPNGVEGQWIPTIPDGTAKDLPYSRKSVTTPIKWLTTVDDGVTWIDHTEAIGGVHNTILNQFDTNGTTNISGRVHLLSYETQAHFTEDDVIGTALDRSNYVTAINNNADAILVSSLVDVVPTSTDNTEELAITKIVNGVVSHTPETMTEDVLFTTQLEQTNNVAKVVFNIGDSGVIDGTRIQSFDTPYFIVEN